MTSPGFGRRSRHASAPPSRPQRRPRPPQRRGAEIAPAGSASGAPGGGPVVSNVATTDRGSFVEISASYCDHTPGAVNDFVYTFRVLQGGSVLAESGYPASQTRACNDLYQTFEDSFPLGTYEVQVLVNNLTNGVSGSAAGSLTVIN